MERKIKENLKPEEHLLWMGRPSREKLMQATDKTNQLICWGVALVLAVVALGLFLPYALGRSDQISLTMTVIAVACLIGIPFAIAIRPYTDKKSLENKTMYAVTDRKIIAVVEDKVMTLPRNDKFSYHVERQADGSSNIYFNGAVNCKRSKSRMYAIMGYHERGSQPGLIYYHVQDADLAKALA